MKTAVHFDRAKEHFAGGFVNRDYLVPRLNLGKKRA
jgi:hypothetical protein